MHIDDAWAEAELERQLAEMGPVSDGESEIDMDEIPHFAAETTGQANTVSESTESEQLPIDMLPSGFRELMQCMQEWETGVVEDTEKEMKELQEVVEDAQSQLHKSPAPLLMDDLEDEERSVVESNVGALVGLDDEERVVVESSVGALNGLDDEELVVVESHEVDLKYNRTWWRWSLHLVLAEEQAAKEEAERLAAEKADAQRLAVEAVAKAEAERLEAKRLVAEQAVKAEADRLAAEETAKANRLAAEQAAKVEAERLALEQAAKEEAQRLAAEEVATAEGERLAATLRWSMLTLLVMMRQEEAERALKKKARRLADEKNAKAVAERLAAEHAAKSEADRLAAEAEAARLAAEKAAKEEAERLAAEQAAKEEAERLAAEAAAKAKTERLEAERIAKAEAERIAAERAAKEEADRLVAAAREEEERQERELHQFACADLESQKLRLMSKVEDNLRSQKLAKKKERHRKRETGEKTTEFPQASVDKVIDPWGSGPIVSSEPSQTSQAVASREAVHERTHLCTSALCEALKEGVRGWRNAGLAWRRPLGASVRPSVKLQARKNPLAKSPSASSTPRGSGLLESHDLDLQDSDCVDESVEDLVKFELREERLEHIPRWLPRAAQLRILNLTGNRLKSLDPLKECLLLEELLLSQNALTSLKGLKKLERLVVLRARQNNIVDASDIADLPCLRVLDLSMNQLESVQWRTSYLARLELYKNALVSTSFLEDLPSLTYLDLGKNQLTSLDPRISEWNPFLIKLYLYENRIASISPFMLPLLTDLNLNKNHLTTLGPLGFLPSLERLQSKENSITSLALPIAASPLLQTLTLTHNLFRSISALEPVFEHPRLQQLNLSDNPVVDDLMETYRPWVLQKAPHLLELDNEPVSDKEKMPALVRKAINDPYFSFEFSNVRFDEQAVPNKGGCAQKQIRQSQDLGLLGLTKLLENSSEDDDSQEAASSCLPPPSIGFTQNSGCAFKPKDLLQAGHDHLFGRWRDAFEPGYDTCGSGGCMSCNLALWCELLLEVRNAHMAAYLREDRMFERIRKTANIKSSNDMSLLFLRRRSDFWETFLEISSDHYEKLLRSQEDCAHVCRGGSFEIKGYERSTQRILCRVQARWRGIRARRVCAHMQFQRRCREFSDDKLVGLSRIQACWRGNFIRNVLRTSGVHLPVDKQREKRAAQERKAATSIQAFVRGSKGRRVVKEICEEKERRRRKLDWAREMSKVQDEDDEMAEIDLGQLLQDLDVKALGETNAFAVKVPDPVARNTSSSPMARTRPNAVSTENGPMTAWGSPPTTATAHEGSRTPHGNRRAPAELNSSVGSPSSNAGNRLPRRSRSLSSTAESAMTESDGFRGGVRMQQGHDDGNLEETRAAKAFYEARQRRERPPGLPKVSPTSQHTMAVRTGISRGGSLGGRGSGTGRGGRRLAPESSKDTKPLNAQKQLEQYFASQQQDSQGRSSPDSETLEFSTGTLNQKLLRNAMQSPPLSSSSPRARSPKRLST